MNRTLLVLLVIILAGAGVGFVLSKTKQANLNSDGKISIVASTNVYGNIAEQIGGDKVHVTSILSDPNADPHLYETDASNAAIVSNADIVIDNGLGYDDFMNGLLANVSNSTQTIIIAADVLGVSDSQANPHLWYNVADMPKIAAVIETSLAQKDPANKPLYEANLTKFTDALQPTLDLIANIRANFTDAPVAYTERVAGYLLNDAGLTVKTPLGFATSIEDGNEPSPADTLAFETLLRDHGVQVLLYNAQVVSSATQHLKDLAKSAGIPVVGVTETLPASEPTYQAWQYDQTKILQQSLQH